MADRPLALITGASAGIGKALAEVVAADGYDVLLVARRADRLADIADKLPTHASILPLDITADGAGQALMDHVQGMGRTLDVLVNNAGLGAAGFFTERDLQSQTRMVDLNIKALVDLSHRFLPAMLAAGRGGILNVASTAAYQPGPRMGVYYASKAFVLSFSEALWEECRGTGVTVTALCPGPTKSEFGAVAGMEELRVFRYATKMSAATVAAQGWSAFKAGKRVKVTGLQNKVTMAFSSVVPNRVLLPLVKLVQSPA